MKEERLVPKRRFEEFQNNDAWEQRKLGDVTDIFDGTHQTPKYTGSGVKFVSVENISNLETKKYISQEAYEKEYSNKQAEKGDVLMTRIGDIGTSKVIETDQPLAYYVTLALLKPKSVDSDFLSWALASPGVQSDIWKRTLHIAFPKKINLGEINQIKLIFPDNAEQIQIGKFFKHLDQMISLEQRKLEKIKALKSAYLAEMFPAEGERVPKRRFAGFTGEWAELKIGDLGSVAMNKRIFKAQTTEKGDVPFYKIGTFGSKPDAFISCDLFEEYRSKYSYPEIGDILISASGSIGRTVEYLGKDEYFQDSNIVWLKHDGKLNNSFLKQFYMIVNWEGLEGSTIKRLYNKNILETRIYVPSLAEQQKIGEFFKKLDDTITNQQQKSDKLKAMKQAYLQEMFV